MTPKERMAELTARLRDAARQQDPIARAAVELVQLSAAEAKESLVEAAGDDMLRRQGAARHLAKLHKDLTTQPPMIKVQETQTNG